MGYEHQLDRPEVDPSAAAAPANISARVAELYRSALGREATPEEINQWATGPLANDLGAMQQAIYGSPEAQAYSQRTMQGAAPTPTQGPVKGPDPIVQGPDPQTQQQPQAQAAPTAAPAGGAPAIGQNAPTFTPPGYTPPPAFSYGDFVAPDPSNLDNDPSYKYTLRTQQDAIQRSAAARGVLNTGGTINDLLMNAKDIASTGYSNLYNRDLSTYQTNRGNALGEYNTNYGTQYQDPYKYNYMGAQDAFNSKSHQYDIANQYGWAKNLFDFNAGTDQRNFDWNKAKDLFDEKYRLLSL